MFCIYSITMAWKLVRRFLRNPHFARTSNDHIAVCVFLIGSTLALWYETCHVLPHYHPTSTPITLVHTTVAVVLYVSVLINVYKMVRTRTACDLTAIGIDENDEWPYCERCMARQPPRSHHCRVCDVCVLRRDHHCWFAGCCVGHANQRFYVCAIVFMLVAAVYSNIFHWQFVVDRLGHLGSFGMPLCIALPHVCAVFGFLSLYEFLVATLTFLALFVMAMLASLVVIQLVQISHGQTRYERKIGTEMYNNGLEQNVRAVFGERWYVAWLLPWIRSPLPENGVAFKVSEVKTK
jgi:palmitoyltransferase